jgi:hypothetical protein
MKKAIIPAFLLVLGSTVLGATVLQERLAWAAPPLPSVFVANDAASPVPAREQNVDADGNIKVHEQGTADVNVTNTSLQVAPRTPILSGGGAVPLSACPNEVSVPLAIASAIRIDWSSTVTGVSLKRGLFTAAFFSRAAGGDGSAVNLALTRPISFDEIHCFGAGQISVSWVGNNP